MSLPTMPKSAVKIKSRKTFAKEEKGPTQPCFWAATRGVVHTLSGWKGGKVLLR